MRQWAIEGLGRHMSECQTTRWRGDSGRIATEGTAARPGRRARRAGAQGSRRLATPQPDFVVVVGAGSRGSRPRASCGAGSRRWSSSRRASAWAGASSTTTSATAASPRPAATFVGPTMTTSDAGQGGRRRDFRRPTTPATTSTSRRQPGGVERHGPTGTAPPDPLILSDLAQTVAQLDQMSKRCRSSAVEARRRRVGRPDARDWIASQQRRPRIQRLVPMATRPVFGPSRASCRCSTSSSTSPRRATSATPGPSSATSTPAGAQQQRFHGGSSGDRRGSPRTRQAGWRSAPRCAGSSRSRAARWSPTSPSSRQRVIVAVPLTVAGNIDWRLRQKREVLHRTSPQGTLTKVAAV